MGKGTAVAGTGPVGRAAVDVGGIVGGGNGVDVGGGSVAGRLVEVGWIVLVELIAVGDGTGAFWVGGAAVGAIAGVLSGAPGCPTSGFAPGAESPAGVPVGDGVPVGIIGIKASLLGPLSVAEPLGVILRRAWSVAAWDIMDGSRTANFGPPGPPE